MENSRRNGWLADHLKTFVVPHLGRMPVPEPMPYFSRQQMSVIKNAWRSVKAAAGKRPIVLPGRDVFLFEILARREGRPTIFIPECSRLTAEHMAPMKDAFIFDTGFLGSIPRALECFNFALLSSYIRDSRIQVFPKLTMARSLALHIENMPKYWRRGYLNKEGKISQDFSDLEEFERAANVTIDVYKDSSPRFISHRKPLSLFGV